MTADEMAARGAPERIWTFDRYVNGVLTAKEQKDRDDEWEAAAP